MRSSDVASAEAALVFPVAYTVFVLLAAGVMLALIVLLISSIRRHGRRAHTTQSAGRPRNDPVPPRLMDFAEARALAATIGLRYPRFEVTVESRRLPGHPIHYVVVAHGHTLHSLAEWQSFARAMETPQQTA